MSGSTNIFLTSTLIAREVLRLLKNNLVMGNLVYRAYEAEFPGSPKKGGTVTIRKPVKFKVSKTRVRVSSVITEQSITLTVATQAHVTWAFHMVDMTLSIEEYSERYIRPAAAALANTVDADLCALYKDVWNTVQEDTAGVSPHTFMILGKAMQKLDEEACPPEDRVVVLNPAANWAIANALSGMYAQEPSTTAIRKGKLGRIAGCDIYMDQNIKTHLTGEWSSDTVEATTGKLLIFSSAAALPATGLVVGASNNQRIYLTGIRQNTAVAFTQGDVLTVAQLYAVNPMSGESTGSLRHFVVTADITGTNESTLTDIIKIAIQPDIISTGPYKTVSTIPTVGAKVWPVMEEPEKNYPQNLAFHKNAFALVMVPLEKPDGQWGSSITEDGISIRLVKGYDIDEDDEIIRCDILYGVKTIYPELAARILGAEG